MGDHESRDEHFALACDANLRWQSLMNEMMHRDDGFVIVGEVAGAACGYILGWLARNPPIYATSTVGFISELAVSASVRRRGVGTALMEAAREWFRGRGVHEFQLATACWNEDAKAFWERLGGRPILTRYRFE